VFGLTLLFGLGWVVLALTHLDDPVRSGDIPKAWGYLLLGFGLGLAGLFILAHRPGNGLGRLLLGTGLLCTASRFLLFLLSVAGGGVAWAALAWTVLLVGTAAIFFTMFSTPWWFPDGRLPGVLGRAYQVILAVWGITEAYYTYGGTDSYFGLPNPLMHGAWASLYAQLASVLDTWEFWIALMLVLPGPVVAAVRWHRSPASRVQEWVVLVPWLLWAVYTFTLTKVTFTGIGFLVSYWAIAAAWPLGAAFGFTRDRSWQLDRAARRVLTSFTLLALLIFGYFVLGFELPRLLPRADNLDAQLMAGCALAIGVLLRPTVRTVSRAVERFYYGERARPYQVARELAERLSRVSCTTEVPSLLCQTVVGALGLRGASVQLATRMGPRELIAVGQNQKPAIETFPISFEGTAIGELHATPRSGQPVLDRQDRAVVRFLVDEAAPALASLRLTEELQSSRKQLVLAREEERKRLRHDLHDGLGPALSGLRLQIDTARCGLPPDGVVAESLQTASRGIGSAIDELRRITDGLAPADLGRVGLTCALRELADRMEGRRLQVAVDLVPDPLPALPAAVEVAVYRITGEALNNVLRHSGASRARLVLKVTDDEVSVEASDDGEGFPSHSTSTGVGLRSMAERAEELGGSFTAANDARGAVVRAVFPRGSAG
jgi:signal transduction histidine kinase